MGKHRKRIGEQFAAIPKSMARSRAFEDLSPAAVRILIELKLRYNGSNNGEISLSVREAGKFIKGGKDTGGKAIKELWEHGFIKLKNKGVFTLRAASTFKLTFEKMGNHPETNDWKYWPENDASKNKEKYLHPD